MLSLFLPWVLHFLFLFSNCFEMIFLEIVNNLSTLPSLDPTCRITLGILFLLYSSSRNGSSHGILGVYGPVKVV